MCKGAWLFCRRGARLILRSTRCVLMRVSMPATFSLALRALFDATTSPPASPPLRPFFMLRCGGGSTSGSPFRGGKSTMRSPSPCRSTVCSNLAALGWHLSWCHLTPAPGPRWSTLPRRMHQITRAMMPLPSFVSCLTIARATSDEKRPTLFVAQWASSAGSLDDTLSGGNRAPTVRIIHTHRRCHLLWPSPVRLRGHFGRDRFRV